MCVTFQRSEREAQIKISSDSDSNSDSEFLFNEEFSLCKDLSKLTPYSFEPFASFSSSGDESEGEVEVSTDNSVVNSRVGNVDWCVCKACKLMDNNIEILCCQEANEIPEEFFEGKECISLSQGFQTVCLQKCVLDTALAALNDLKGEKPDKKNENYRYAAYKQFTWWIHSHLGKGVRKVIPSCVVWSIRNTYPTDDNKYVEFQHAPPKK